MAVRHPRYNGRFAIGIECDGAMYQGARIARERDRLRQIVFEDMEWRIHRIWSTDWIKDCHTERERLVMAVQQAINNYHENTPTAASNTNDSVRDFLKVSTISADESIREGIEQKFMTHRSPIVVIRQKRFP